MGKFINIGVFVLCLTAGGMLSSAPRIQFNIQSGKYVPSISVTIGNLRSLPVPSNNQDYAFLQSLGREVNVIIGSFSKGEREIILYKDTNADGRVEFVVHWFVDLGSPRYEPRPDEFCPPERFRKLKEDIIMGRQGEITPNRDGMEYLLTLVKSPENIKKWQKGFIVTKKDLDDPTVERVRFSFSDNAENGADMVFDIIYIDRGVVRESPVINQGIYCKGSRDPFIIETVKKLTSETAKYYVAVQ